MAQVEGIKVNIDADATGLDRELSSAQKNLVKFAGAVSAAIAAVPAALVAMGRASMGAIDSQAKLAKQFGTTTISIQTMQRAADLSGVSMGALQSASERLNRTLGEVARTGEGQAFEALKRVGLSAQQLASVGSDERLAMIADAIKGMGMSATQTADFLAQLGIRQAEVSRMLMDGGDAIRSAREQVNLYGVAISEIDAKRIEEANDKWSELSYALTGIGNQVAVQLAPVMTDLAEKFQQIIRDAGGIERVAAKAFEGLYRAVKLVADNMDTLVRVAVVLIGLKLAAVVINIGLAFIKMASALRMATVATMALNVAKGGLVKGLAVAAGGVAAIEVATGGALKIFDRLGISTDALTRSLSDFKIEAGGAEGALARLAAAQKNQMISGSAAILPVGSFIGGKPPPEKPGDKPPPGGGAAKEDPLAAEREAIIARHTLIKEGFMTEHELLVQKYEQDLNTIDGYYQIQMEKFRGNKEMEVALAQEHNALMQKIEEQHQNKLAEIRNAGFNEALTASAKVFGSLQKIAQSGSKKNVKAAKVFGIAEALISTFVAANKAMAFAATAGPAAAFAAYASVAAKGLAAVASIRSISDSGSGGGGGAGAAGASSGGGGAAAASGGEAAGRAPGGNSVYINLQGQSFGRDQVRDLVKQIADFQKDGGQVVFA
jgi:hypothetical protein